MHEADRPPFERLGPEEAPTPLVCAVPHAGRNYSPALLRDSAVPRHVLEELEDRHADLLVEQAAAAGAVAIVTRTARALIDLNRAPEETDPAMGGTRPAGLRVRSGLGLVPRRLGGRELIGRLPRAGEVAHRIAAVHVPYHQAIERALGEAIRRHGCAVLLDCHSMPPLRGGRVPRVVIGDRHGRSAARHVTEAAVRAAGASGLHVALNAPYAGAYTLDRHGRPASDIHALQIEVDRTLYLDRYLREPGEGVEETALLIHRIGLATMEAARVRPAMEAARVRPAIAAE